jgi:hypothetical protein
MESPVEPSVDKTAFPRWAACVVAIALLAGAVARLVWVGDMEWKYDEHWCFEKGEAVARGDAPLPWLGMNSSLGIPNPGPSAWIFAALATFAKTPESMCRSIQILNVLAIFGFVWIARTRLTPTEREPWYWGLALGAVNPASVRFARKIWMQSVTPPLTLVVWFGHLNRRTRWGAFTWGLMGALIGQVHMSGFFLAAALVAWTAFREWRDPEARGTRWGWWLAGSVIGALPMIPWVWAVLHTDRLPSTGETPTLRSRLRGLKPRFWALWFARSVGLDILYADKGFDILYPLGWLKVHLLREPIIDGRPTWLIAILVTILTAIGLLGVARWTAGRLTGTRPKGPGYPTAVFYAGAAGLGAGILIFLITPWTYDHYLIILFPFPFVWLALVLLPDRRLLATVVVLQALLTATFLTSVHRAGGFPGTDYGVTYARQAAEGIGPPREPPPEVR